MVLDVTFDGLAAPLRLTRADGLLPLLGRIAAGWPHQSGPADPRARPFFTIAGQPDGPAYLCASQIEDRPARTLDPVNALCDAIASLAMALPAEDDRILCLHAAGVAMAGRVVIFPNVRRAGKSTLSAALARAGHEVVSDDVLPIRFPRGGAAEVQSMGIAPRLRLPLPDSLPGGFRDWASRVPGPENRQYKYLTLPEAPRQGASLPVGAFVILDRRDDPVATRIAPVTPDAAMDALLHQNFTRDRHSGDVLAAMAAMLADLPVWQLTYCDLDMAVACLRTAFARWERPAGGGAEPLRFRLADVGARPPGRAARRTAQQRPGVVVREIGAGLYLADPEGRAIHRADPLAAAIWEVLATPATPEDIADILAEAFPGTPRARLLADVEALIDGLAEAGLVA